MNGLKVFVPALMAGLLAVATVDTNPASAAPIAPRGQETQAPRGQEIQAPRGQETQAP
jgi:hypothetical protein